MTYTLNVICPLLSFWISLLFLSPWYILLPPHWPPCSSLDMPKMFFSHDLCTCFHYSSWNAPSFHSGLCSNVTLSKISKIIFLSPYTKSFCHVTKSFSYLSFTFLHTVISIWHMVQLPVNYLSLPHFPSECEPHERSQCIPRTWSSTCTYLVANNCQNIYWIASQSWLHFLLPKKL